MPEPLLQVDAIDAFYGDFQALFGVSLRVDTGQVVAVIGANGAGKSTLLKTIAGLMHPRHGAIAFDGEAIAGRPAFAVVKPRHRAGAGRPPAVSLADRGGKPADRRRKRRRPGPWTLARVYALFPVLAERRHLPAPALSGGQQQMAAIARALMANPRLLLCDEISLGLAPIIVRDIYARLPEIVAEGLSLIIVEQDIVQALRAASQVYCLQEGRVALAGRGRGAHAREHLGGVFRGVRG